MPDSAFTPEFLDAELDYLMGFARLASSGGAVSNQAWIALRMHHDLDVHLRFAELAEAASSTCTTA